MRQGICTNVSFDKMSFCVVEMNQHLETRDSPSSEVEMNAKLATETSIIFLPDCTASHPRRRYPSAIVQVD
jgi:hypothetical protein